MKSLEVRSKVWLYPGMAGWHFLSVPKAPSVKVKEAQGKVRRGWNSIPVTVTLGNSRWKTSIFPDKRSGEYLLPLKAEVRKKEAILEGDVVTFTLSF